MLSRPAATPASRPATAAPILTPVTPVTKPSTEGTIVYPDGSRLPTLNGVRTAPQLNWPPERPFSPVVGKRMMPNGHEWYQHADGTMTTTIMLFRSDLGREDPVCQVAVPTPPLPLDAEAQKR